ncbi:TPA: cystatin-like fold lipoprotein [Staphylococcus pseudintermedius]|uniref:cystatin-like fold lipoprotein n=1 Tax=Staphylococcus pseudintermedius TaxID=283734 RepID=UPI0015F1DCEE|nr:cystatin-like fold lipoprotein [Staphylococcus pseudintermedius]MDU9278985.1 cystatin-like fold lipoprotein [Staphylococcus pseudintermedius]QDX56288.1 cystatin-like fold lipoprotein [Staphylococcus pseudintermedius]HAR6196585.1 cystatin-like fold lipoprotein [Staphylococcus pseudintermedius]
MRKSFILFMSLIFVLAACGKKYDKEIEQVTKLEQKSVEESQLENVKKFERNSSDYKVYENGNKIVVSYNPFKDSETVMSDLFEKNQTSGDYEEVENVNVEKYQKNNKPDYEENNLKK